MQASAVVVDATGLGEVTLRGRAVIARSVRSQSRREQMLPGAKGVWVDVMEGTLGGGIATGSGFVPTGRLTGPFGQSFESAGNKEPWIRQVEVN